MNEIFNSNIKLTDDKYIVHNYTPVAVFLISRYSDTGTVVKQEADGYVEYNGSSFSKSTPLSNSKMGDLLNTCSKILAFYRDVCILISSVLIILFD